MFICSKNFPCLTLDTPVIYSCGSKRKGTGASQASRVHRPNDAGAMQWTLEVFLMFLTPIQSIMYPTFPVLPSDPLTPFHLHYS